MFVVFGLSIRFYRYMGYTLSKREYSDWSTEIKNYKVNFSTLAPICHSIDKV